MAAIENWNSYHFNTWRWPNPVGGWLEGEKRYKYGQPGRLNLAAVKLKDTKIFFI